MARVEIASLTLGLLTDAAGNSLTGRGLTITNAAGQSVTPYAAATGSATVSPTSGALGYIPGYLEEGTYTFTVDGSSHTVDVVSGPSDFNVKVGGDIQAALDAAAVGGGTVNVGPGIFDVDYQENPLYAGFFAALLVPGNVKLQGAGVDATTIKLVGSAASHTSATIIGNLHLDNAHGANDENITVCDLTVDGNGANQTTLYQGINWTRVRGVRHHRVRVRNVRGTASFPPGETFFFNSTESGEVSYVDCEAIGDVGTHGSGFGDNYATNVAYVGCHARGMSAGMGFASFHGRNISYAACHATKNGAHGFNCEYGERVVYSACHSGGRASDGAGSQFPFTTNQLLGNSGSGWTINATVKAELDGCFSSYNANTGVAVVTTGSDHSDVRIIGGGFTNNTAQGIYFGDPTNAQASFVSPATRLASNSAQFGVNGGVGDYGGTADGFGIPAPSVPATGVALTNPYPHDVTIYLAGGTLFFVNVDGATTGLTTPATYELPANKTIQVNYSVAPTWVWVRR